MQFVISAAFLLLAFGIWYIGWLVEPARWFPIAMVLSAPLIAFALLPLLASLASGSLRTIKQIAYREIEGRHFEYRGKSIRVHEDLAGNRWLRTRDIKKVIAKFPQDQVWMNIAPEDLGRMEAKHGLFLNADALDNYLARSQDAAAIRFRNWLQREVMLPAKRASELGIAQTSTREYAPPAAP